MTVEYNLVILGDGPVAGYAAEYARSLNARVALVTGLSSQSAHSYPNGIYTDTMTTQALRRMGNALPPYLHGPHPAGSVLFSNTSSKLQNLTSKIPWSQLVSLTQTLIKGQFEARSLSALEELGIDVVYANDVDQFNVDQFDNASAPRTRSVEFYGDSVIGLKTRHRKLPSQAYLIAMDGEPVIPVIPGIEQVSYSTLDTFLNAANPLSAASNLIISNNQQGIEVACALGSLGIDVILVMEPSSLVEDEEAHQWLTTPLNALGIKTYWGTSVIRLEQRDGQCVAYLKTENGAGCETTEAIADHLLLAMGRQVDFTALQLGAVGIAYDHQGIRVDSGYQSHTSRLFACGDAIGSPPDLNQRYGEVAIAVHHALFDQPLWNNAWLSNLLLRRLKQWLKPSLPPAPFAAPKIINTSPPLAYIGYSETKAHQRYGDCFTILRQPYGSLDQAQLLRANYPHSTTGWCKLLVLDEGQIVGAYVWGVQSEEVMGAIALAMHHSIPMEELGQLCPPMPSITAEVLQSLGLQWERERIKGRSLLFDWLELFFNWQRDWTR